MRRSAFTIIEVLVTIAIIAMLAALLLPALRLSRKQAEVAVCGSNISQLLKGMFSYELENQNLPYGLDSSPKDPPTGGYPGYRSYDRPGWWWFNQLEDYYSNANKARTVALCPSKRLRGTKFKNNVLCGNYGVNRSICKGTDDKQSRMAEFVGTPLRSSDMPRPASTLLIVDSGYSIISWWNAVDEPPVVLSKGAIEDTAYVPGLWINERKDLWPDQKPDAIDGRHPRKTVNVGFADGHVSLTKAKDLFVEKTGVDYKNKKPLWVPK
ncbi:MAG: prepilin-type N-terminal cleavage/methylation domain-containing protein [Phycisphaerae bacterium]|nr:prepilin-type N-terminal cleavage/methylation domain-containing protein [Phycisphaerae bacterium]MDD5380134.1 prepilin-type N-terminal cleavage/methylation domain-containing protein [Phycisphaerae bacterium]